jgi:hypothetical protein
MKVKELGTNALTSTLRRVTALAPEKAAAMMARRIVADFIADQIRGCSTLGLVSKQICRTVLKQ